MSRINSAALQIRFAATAISRQVTTIAGETLALLCPAQACLCCRWPVYRALALCEQCEAELPWQAPGCQRCGISVESNVGLVMGECMNCQQAPPGYDRCMPLFAYQAPVSGMINRFKQYAGFSEARCLGLLLSAAFRQYYLEQNRSTPAFLLPVPLHSSRIRQRGFNQALMLSQTISKSTGTPVLRRACERQASLHTQRGLSAQARQLNMQGIFYAGRQVHLTAGRHIAIIDDVVTTTATVNSMSAVLRQHGVARIDIWCVARAN